MELESGCSRREFVKLAAAVTAGIGVVGSNMVLAAPPTGAPGAAPARNADDVLHELMAGNERFATGQPKNPRRSPAEFRPLAQGQNPVAAVIGCADSRVPPEVLFDVGVGDLFVVRIAGNVVGGAGASVKGSVEYAVAELNVPLIMVLGHSSCGAVKAAVKHIDAHDALPGAINGLVDLIKPAVAKAKGMKGDLLENAIRMNVLLGVARLEGLQPVLAGPVKQGRVKVVGGVYDLETGKVALVGRVLPYTAP
jgi:carbonic anhydrase